MKKGCLIAIGAVFAFIALIVGAALLLTSGATEAGTAFFTLLGQGKTAEAYRSTASGFQSSVAEADFTRIVGELGLDRCEKASWSDRQVQNNAGKLVGSLALKGGKTIEMTVELVHEDGAWKVLGFTTPLAMPDAEGRKELVLKTLLAFNDAVAANDFTKFHSGLAKPFREQFTPAKLKETFAAFIERKIDLQNVRNLTPEFSPAPAMQGDVLVLAGSYPTTPVAVLFELKFLNEMSEWRPVGVSVQLK